MFLKDFRMIDSGQPFSGLVPSSRGRHPEQAVGIGHLCVGHPGIHQNQQTLLHDINQQR